MIVLHEQFTTSRPAREVFAYACEFAHCEQWDATAVSSRRIDAGPTRVGSRYRVDVKQIFLVRIAAVTSTNQNLHNLQPKP